MKDVLTDEATNLLAQCVEVNVKMAAHTTDLIIRTYEAQLRDLADAYTRLYDGLAIIPDTQRTVYVDRLLARGDHVRDRCDQILLGERTT